MNKEQTKENKKYNKENKKYNKDNKGKNKPGKTEKIKFRLQRMIEKTESLKEKKNEELNLLNMQQEQLEKLLAEADKLDFDTLKKEIKNIISSYKVKRKNKFKGKRGKHGGRGRGRGRGRCGGRGKNKYNKKDEKKDEKRLKKEEKKNLKKEKKLEKEEKKALKDEKKEKKRLQKEERKRIKREKAETLDAARLLSLPSSKKQIGNKNMLKIYVDGYNIIGCDSLCRKSMRGRGGSMGKSRKRLTKLLQEKFLNKKNTLNLSYDVTVYLWFDGNGKNHKNGDIEVTFSTKKQIVDDKLVETFNKNKYSENSNILVITTDKELTLRLYEIGVKVIKSSTFYKTYLKEEKKQNNDDKNDDEKNDKEEETEQPGSASGSITDDQDPIFNKFCSQKMDKEDDGENTPDEMENDSNDEDYSFIDNDDDFDETFGEDSDEYQIE